MSDRKDGPLMKFWLRDSRRSTLRRVGAASVPCVALLGLCASLSIASPDPPADCSQVPAAASIQKLLADGDFDGLDRLASRARDCKVETPDGLRALDAFYSRVVNLDAESSDSRHKDLIRRFEKWTKAKPQSPAAHVALAMTYTSFAWRGRGVGAASTVTEQGWKLFRERMGLAQAELGLELLANDPQTYVEKMKAAKAGVHPPGMKDKEYALAMFQKGIQADADYYPLYYEFSTTLLPHWGGGPGEWEAFAKEYSDKRGGLEGQILYTRILWDKSRWFWHWDYLPKSNEPWSGLKTRLDAIAEKRPDSMVEKNLYCYFAALGLDFKTASGLFDWIEAGGSGAGRENERKVSWVWKNRQGGDDYAYYRVSAQSTRQAIFEMDVEPLVAARGLLTFTTTVQGPDGSPRPELGYQRSITVDDFRILNSVKKHTRLAKIPDAAAPGRYVITMVAKNNATGVERTWTQEVGEAK
jgi:hypothetical protein